MMKSWIHILFLSIFFLSGCSAVPTDAPILTAASTSSITQPVAPAETEVIAEPTHTAPAPDMTKAVTARAENLLGMEPGTLTVVSSEPVQWINGCLGISEAGESCMEKITDGYKLILQADGHSYEIHSDQSAENVRVLGLFPEKTPSAVRLAMMDLADRLAYGASRIDILSFSAVDWPDACLGVVSEQMCAQVITPGFEATFLANGRVFIYHTDETGEKVVLYQDGYGQSGMRNVIIVLDTNSPDCTTAMISDEDVSSGACNSEIVSHPLAASGQSIQLNWFADTYAPFEMQTDSARLRFSGRGGQIASPAEQRAIFEWATRTKEQAETGVFASDAGLAATIEQSGGFAGICRMVYLNLNGWISEADCRQGDSNFVSYRMTSVELQQLFDLYDRLVESQTSYSVPPVAEDGYQYQIHFYGAGKEEAVQADLDLLQKLAR